MRRALLFNIVFMSLLLGAPALAAEPARRVLRLQYSEDGRAASCPGEAALREQIQARTGYDPFREDAPEEVGVEIVSRGADLVAKIRYRDAGGKVSSEREFDAPNDDAACRLLTSYTALSIAFTLTPFGLDERAPAATAPPPEVAPPAPPRARRPAPPRPEPAIDPDTLPHQTQLGAGGYVRFGATSEVLGGVSCIARSRMSRRVTLAIEIRKLMPFVAPLGREGADQDPSSPGSSGEPSPYTESLLSGALVSCFHARAPFVGCGIMEVSMLLLAGQPGADPDAALLMMTLGLRGGVEVPLTDWLGVYGHAELLLTAFRLRDTPAVGAPRTPRLAASLGAGLLTGF
ncbi:hypothetical protein [Sorangium sp. So ce1335]|uniref:hypothetical protein n=1 Tax=Sorangium sp. So ce1335 TaxID=3133335 RepID=UPI003F60A79B